MRALVPVLLASLLAGCNAASGAPNGFDKPTIAVMKFENRAPFPLGWRVGDAFADVLVDRLVKTDRYQVVERPELGEVVRELDIQKSGITRTHGRAEPGRIKNVQYLIKGVVTDFGHVETTSGWFSMDWFNLFGSGTRAVMGITMYVVDVESGQIICSESIQQSVRATDANVTVVYRNMAFGGSTFQRTPLGKATATVIGKAVQRVTEVIAAQPWEPRVAMVRPNGAVLINGGENHSICIGQEYDVLDAGEPVVDPRTGDVLGRHSSATVGRVRVYDVQPQYAAATIVSGKAQSFEAGQRCRRAYALATALAGPKLDK
jgi:curli biogenesis system outer membrane secretion channel CsgG